MTEQEQQITIAKACGWREAFPKNEKAHEETKRPGILLPYYWVNEKTHERAMDLPDYLHDLNSMHFALMGQSREFRERFQDLLDEYCNDNGKLKCELEAFEYATLFLKVNAI